MRIGLEQIANAPPKCLSNARIGLLINQASVDRANRMACDVFAEQFGKQLTCIFSPQHGIWGEQQANMIETEHSTYAPLGIPVYSLYSDTRRPTQQMLDSVDVVVVDLQDVGTRVYTFVWTLLEVLHACAQAGKTVLVLDRPNPLGGRCVEGPPLADDHRSFVGGECVELRHGLTIAEIAKLCQQRQKIDVDLHILAMDNWDRGMWRASSERRWIWPSPNMPTLSTAYVYPGQVLLEGMNLSEGRGTTRPFELVGAPFIDADRWLAELARSPCDGIEFSPVRFLPTFDKFAGESCSGIDLRVTAPEQVRSVSATLTLLASATALWPDQVKLLGPPYEYETVKAPLDILWGNDSLRLKLADIRDGRCDWVTALELANADRNAWRARTEDSLLY
ncbi:MAG: DUF1343 domain-containing protein [Aureliella sp.]